MIKKIVESDQAFLKDSFCREGSYKIKVYFCGIKLWEKSSTTKNSLDDKSKKDGVGFAQ